MKCCLNKEKISLMNKIKSIFINAKSIKLIIFFQKYHFNQNFALLTFNMILKKFHHFLYQKLSLETAHLHLKNYLKEKLQLPGELAVLLILTPVAKVNDFSFIVGLVECTASVSFLFLIFS